MWQKSEPGSPNRFEECFNCLKHCKTRPLRVASECTWKKQNFSVLDIKLSGNDLAD